MSFRVYSRALVAQALSFRFIFFYFNFQNETWTNVHALSAVNICRTTTTVCLFALRSLHLAALWFGAVFNCSHLVQLDFFLYACDVHKNRWSDQNTNSAGLFPLNDESSAHSTNHQENWSKLTPNATNTISAIKMIAKNREYIMGWWTGKHTMAKVCIEFARANVQRRSPFQCKSLNKN